MVAIAKLNSDFGDFQVSADAMLEKFTSGSLYVENRSEFFSLVMAICNHFKRGINNVQGYMNDVVMATNNFENDPESGMDFINDLFDVVEDYIEFICEDFSSFRQTLLSVVPKEDLEYRCGVDFNLVEYIVEGLSKSAEHIRSEMLGYFVSKLSDEQLLARATL